MATTDRPAGGVERTNRRQQDADQAASRAASAYLRAENEDDDGYDPYSDRPAAPEPLFERDPWA